MQKKILSILLALAMVLAMAPVSVFAQDAETNETYYESGDFFFYVTDAHVGATVEITIGTDFNSFDYGELVINFDSEYLSYIDFDAEYLAHIGDDEYINGHVAPVVAGIPVGYTQEDGIVNVGMAALKFTGTENFVTLKFKVLKEESSILSVNVSSWEADTTPDAGSVTVNIINHNYVEVVTAPTCGEQGYTTYTCSICGYSYIANYTPATEEHSYKNVVVTEPTHSANGYTTYTCDCGAYYTDNYVSIHTFNDDLYCDVCGKYALNYGIDDGVAYVSGCDGYEKALTGSIVILGTIEGYPVVICTGAFGLCTNLTDVTITDGITDIYEYTFIDCINLKSVIIPDSVKYIGNYAFGYYDDENPGEPLLVDDFTIYGYTGSAAETYAKENGITFVAIDDTVSPDEPVQDTSSNVLTPNADRNITVTDTIVNLSPEMSVEDIILSVENENIQIFNKDDETIASDALVGTGCIVKVSDADGNVLSEYKVVVKADVNGDAKITAADARLALRDSANLEILEDVYATAANYNGDSDITAADARMILRKSAGLE